MKLSNPVPHASEDPGLQFGATKPRPYSTRRPHKGKDYKWSASDYKRSHETYAAVSGTVEEVYNDGGNHEGWGNYVLIRVNSRVQWRGAHHATGTVRFRKGQKVKADQRMGTMGDTGETYGTHFHEELIIDDVRVNPDLYRGPNGRELPDTEPTPKPTPKPTPAPKKARYSNMFFLRANGENAVYEVSTGRRRLVPPEVWKAIVKWHDAEKIPLPYSDGVLSKAEVNRIPTAA